MGSMNTAICGGSNDQISNTGPYYNFINACGHTWNATESIRQSLISADVTLSNLSIYLTTAPGTTADRTRTFTVYKNGSPTSLTVTLTQFETTGVDSVNSVSFTAGDRVSLASSHSGSMFSQTKVYFALVATGSNRTCILSGGMGALMSGSTTQYVNLNGGGSVTSSPNFTAGKSLPTTGILKNLYVNHSANNGVNTTYTLYKNGSSTALATTINSGSTTANNTANQISVTTGDIVYIVVTYSGSSSSHYASWGMVFAPDVDGESIQMYSASGTESIGYAYIGSNVNSGMDGTQSNVYMGSPNCVARKLYAIVFASPGGADSDTYTYTLMKGASTTALTVTLIGTDGSESDTTHSETYSDANGLSLVSMRRTSTGSPSASPERHSYVTYITPVGETGVKVNSVLSPAKIMTVPIGTVNTISRVAV